MPEIIEVGKVSEDIAKESVAIAERVLIESRSIIVKTDEDYLAVGESLKSDKKYLAMIEDERKKATGKLNDVVRTINNWFRNPKENLEKAISIKSDAMYKYQQKKEEVARIEQARLQDIANKEAEKLAERARKASEKGNEEKAKELLAQSQMKQAVIPTVVAEAPKIAGITTRDSWTFEVVDANLVPREYLMVDEKKVGQVVRATKGTLQIAGIKVVKETKMAGSR